MSTVDGVATDASGRLTGVTKAAVSPDGRRVALVADGAVYVSSLIISNQGGRDTVTIGYFPARNGKPLGFIRTITLPNSQTIEFQPE